MKCRNTGKDCFAIVQIWSKKGWTWTKTQTNKNILSGWHMKIKKCIERNDSKISIMRNKIYKQKDKHEKRHQEQTKKRIPMWKTQKKSYENQKNYQNNWTQGLSPKWIEKIRIIVLTIKTFISKGKRKLFCPFSYIRCLI